MTDNEKNAVDAFEVWWKSTKHYDKRYYEKRQYTDGSGWFYAWDSTDKAWKSWAACWVLLSNQSAQVASKTETLRDQFAKSAMNALIILKNWEDADEDTIAACAYTQADAMLNARNPPAASPAA